MIIFCIALTGAIKSEMWGRFLDARWEPPSRLVMAKFAASYSIRTMHPTSCCENEAEARIGCVRGRCAWIRCFVSFFFQINLNIQWNTLTVPSYTNIKQITVPTHRVTISNGNVLESYSCCSLPILAETQTILTGYFQQFPSLSPGVVKQNRNKHINK